MNTTPQAPAVQTPRTDAEITRCDSYQLNEPDLYHVDADFARQLETELSAAVAENARLRVAFGIQPSEKIPQQEPQHGSILVDHGSTRKRISPVDDEVVRLTDALADSRAEVERLKREIATLQSRKGNNYPNE